MGKREYNEARLRATTKYVDARARISIVVEKPEAAAWKAAAEAQGVSLTQLIRAAVNNYVENVR